MYQVESNEEKILIQKEKGNKKKYIKPGDEYIWVNKKEGTKNE